MVNISSWTELNAARNQPYESFTLIANLKITDADYNGIGNAWAPLCYDYQGTFNGNGHYIEGLSAPLFGSLYICVVTKLGLKDISISGASGGLANGAMYSTVDNCWVTGTISGANVGGLIGEGYYWVGITNCYANVTVTGSGTAGGLMSYSPVEIVNCFSTGNVTGSTVGGLIGSADVAPTNCGWVTTTATNAIGSLGGSPANVTYNEATLTPYYFSSHGVFSAWDFVSTWHTNTGALPTLNPIGTTPTTPVLSFTLSTDSSVTLVWTASTTVGGEMIGYKIERALAGGTFSVLVANTGNLNLTYTDSSTTTKTEYDYKVTGLAYGTSSAVSNVVRAIAKNAALKFLADGIEVPTSQFVYYGDPNTDGSLRESNNGTTLLLQKRVNGSWVETTSDEVDPVFTAHPAYGLTTQDMIDIGNLSGTNTGDQVLPTRDSLGLDTDDTVTFANLSGTNTGDQTLPVNSDFNLSDLGDVDDTDKAEGKILKVDSEGNHVYVTDESGTDEKVKYDVSDQTAGYIADKFVAGSGISLAEGTGADENKLKITNSGVVTETDPVYSGSQAANITATDITNLGNLSGTNTGDQDLSGYLLLDQTTPQTFSAGTVTGSGLLNVSSGTIGLDTNTYLPTGGWYDTDQYNINISGFNNDAGYLVYGSTISYAESAGYAYSSDYANSANYANNAGYAGTAGTANYYAETDPLSLHTSGDNTTGLTIELQTTGKITGEMAKVTTDAPSTQKGDLWLDTDEPAPTPVADGTYTIGLGSTQDGTITVLNGIITAIQEVI